MVNNNVTTMSADDFQTKYASVMESMLKSAVAETTKLFETMVDELKAEISRIKKENEDLKTRCSQFESVRSQATVYTRDSEPVSWRRGGSEKRDTAVQCDLVPVRTMPVEQCQPLGHSSLHNHGQQCGYDEMQYIWREHNYERNSQMAFKLVKQKGRDSSMQSVLKQKEVEPTAAYRQVLNDKAGSPQASVCGTKNKRPFINKLCSTGEISLPRRGEKTQVARDNILQGAQNQSSEPEQSPVISLAETDDDIEEESKVVEKILEIGTQGDLITSEKQIAQPQSEIEPHEEEQPSVVSQHRQRKDRRSVHKQTDVTLQQFGHAHSTEEQFANPTPLNKGEACDKLKNVMSEGEASSQPDLVIRRRRGRPPKRVKLLKQPVKQILPSTIRVAEVQFTSSESPQSSSVQPKESSFIANPSVQERANTALEHVEKCKVGSLDFPLASLGRRYSSGKKKSSESQQPSMDMEESSIQSPPAPSVEPRERCTSATLQDAILLVEAMNQSTTDNVFVGPQRMAAPPQTQCVPCVGTLKTVYKIPSETHTPPVGTEETAGSLPNAELSTTTQVTKEELSAAHKTANATPTNKAVAHVKAATPIQQHSVTSVLSSTAPTSVQSLQQHPPNSLITSEPPSKQDNAVPRKIIVMPRSASSSMPRKSAPLSESQLSTVVSAVVAAQNNSILPSLTSADIPLVTPSLSSVPQKTITSRKSLPVITSQSTTKSTDTQLGSLPPPRITVIIPKQTPVASRKHQSQTIVLAENQESDKSAAAVTLSSSQLMSSSQELSISEDEQTTLHEVATISSEKRNNTSDNIESPKQTASVSETIREPTETSSSSNMSVGLVPATVSPTVPQTFEQKLSAVVRLTRLPFPLSTTETVLVSLPENGSSETLSIVKEGPTQEQSSSVVISTQPSERLVLSNDICSNLKETSVGVPVSTPQISEELSDIQEKTSLSSENCLEESTYSGHLLPSAPFLNNEPSSVSDTAGKRTTSNLGKEIINIAVQDCALPNDQPTEDKQSAALIHLTPITSKETCDPHSHMTKAQFLAQLAVSPVMQDPEKASDPKDARASCAETSTTDKRLQKNTLVAQLRSHLKKHSQARRTDGNQEPRTETETCTVSPMKPKLEKDSLKDKNTNSDPTVSPENPGVVEDVASLKKTTNDFTPISRRRSGICKNAVRSKRTFSEPTSLRSGRSKATGESTLHPVSPRRSSSDREGVGSKNKKSASVSPRRCSSAKESANPKKTKNTSVSPKKSNSPKESASPKKTKNTSVCPRRASSTSNGASPKNTETETTSVRPKRTSLSRDNSPKKTQSLSDSPGTSGLSTYDSSPKTPTTQSPPFCRRRCTFSQDGSSAKQIKRYSNSFSSRRCSITADGASTKNSKSETGVVRWPKLAKNSVTPRNTGESTPAKKPKLIKDGNGSKNNLRVENAKKLAKAAKVKTIAKIKNSNQSNLRKGAKTSQLAESHASCDTVKRITAKAVWTPPRQPASKTPRAGGKRPSPSSIKKETRSQNNTVIYPPSVSLLPIPVRAPPVVSPLQPLSVIGRRLLKNQCGECGRVLSSSAALQSHVSLHSGHRPFSCKQCGKRFPDSKGLKRHGRVHRNGRIHICPQCGKGFVYRFGLTKHLGMVHARIKPFVCQICNKGFFTKRDVEAHIRIHTGEKPFHCNLCEKKFARRVELNVHLRWHNGEKRHWCPYCGKGFLDFNNLKRHKYTHTGEKPHSCPHCPKKFTQSGHLKKHVKNVHKIQ